ncbi:MAG: amidase [Acidisphaera sp.]|nr:amidase [Acidisphaera sp.]
MTADFATLTALELLAGYRRREFSPVEVVSGMLARAERLNPQLCAFYLIDHDEALAAARESEARWTKDKPCGPLDGVPSSVKDALASKGHPSYRGSAAHRADEQTWDTDVPGVARMRDAGAVFLGKTTMPDFGILPSGVSSRHGITRNPWNLARTSGGSSAGAAASIAAGINPLAIGTDIVGSIRLPASYCGLVGHKPSYGRVPYYFPNSPALVAGPMARDVADAALLMNVLAGPDKRDFTALPPDGTDYSAVSRQPPRPGARIGFCPSLGFGLNPDPEVVALVGEAVRAMEADGASVRSIPELFSRADLLTAERFFKVRCRTELVTMPPHRRAEADVIENWSAEADTISAVEFYALFSEVQRMRERAARIFDDLDFLILPSVHAPAFPAELPGPDPRMPFEPFANSFLFNLTEQPASSVPCGYTHSGLPVGLQIVGQRYDDRGVFTHAAWLEAAIPTRRAQDALIKRLGDCAP